MCTKITDINNSQLPHCLEKESQEATTSKSFCCQFNPAILFSTNFNRMLSREHGWSDITQYLELCMYKYMFGTFLLCAAHTIRHPYCFIIVYYKKKSIYITKLGWSTSQLSYMNGFFFILFPTLASYVCKCFHYFSFVDRTIGGDLFQPVKNRILLVT